MWDQVVSSPYVKYGAVLSLTAGCLILVRKWIAGGTCKSKARLDGKTALITGANTGIGKETARDLARRGARVVMACRDLTRAENAAEEIQRTTGNGNVVIRHLNLASLYSVREFAKDFLATEERLDILVNNAGKVDFDDMFFDKRPYNSLVSYKQSKLANVLFSRELARRMRGTGVTSYSLHPGVIRTELGRHVESWHPLLKTVLSLPCILLMKTPWQGAQTTIYCAVTEGLESKSGCYFSDCVERQPSPEGKDDEVARRLWEESARLVGLTKER
ncbi:retinol dehydrogenase 13 isoform X1 [Pygocentrus nattereri]|uniref:retinol dehydrogenase 13 isoform X1 n=1 Tax=Pygocentrus nattereri TaxID=42514 RepID=UPI0008142BE0|nr:retinol dehydrogenase 13 isoform X1 [Pygocentrus nattereri]